MKVNIKIHVILVMTAIAFTAACDYESQEPRQNLYLKQNAKFFKLGFGDG